MISRHDFQVDFDRILVPVPDAMSGTGVAQSSKNKITFNNYIYEIEYYFHKQFRELYLAILTFSNTFARNVTPRQKVLGK